MEQSDVMLGHTHIIVLRLPESDVWLILCGHCDALNQIVRLRQSSGKQQTLQQDTKMHQNTTQAKVWSDILIKILILQALFNFSASNMIHSSIHGSFSRAFINRTGAGTRMCLRIDKDFDCDFIQISHHRKPFKAVISSSILALKSQMQDASCEIWCISHVSLTSNLVYLMFNVSENIQWA